MHILYPVYLEFPSPKARCVQIVHTAAALSRLGHRVDLMFGHLDLSPENGLRRFGLDPAGLPNLTVHSVPSMLGNRSRWFPWRWRWVFDRALPRAIRRLQGPESVLYLREIKTAGALLPFLRKHAIPFYYEAHHIEHTTLTKKAAQMRELESHVYGASEGVICISSQTEEEVWDLNPAVQATRVICNGCVPVDLPKGGGDYLLYVGQFCRRKNVDCIVSMMQHLPDEKLVLVGGESEEAQKRVKALATQLGVSNRVQFVGQVPYSTVAAYAVNAKALLAPLRKQLYNERYTCPLKLLEYLTYGKPIIAADLPSVTNLITPGAHALVADAEDPKQWAQAVYQLRDDALCDRLASSAKELSKQYSYDARAQRIADFMTK